MNIVQRAREFVQQQHAKTDWQRCPHCGSKQTQRHGRYERHPWRLCSRQTVSVQRHRCLTCGRTYSELPSGLKRGSWYGREVQRLSVDLWLHGRMSLRRVAEFVRSVLGRQERWRLWHAWQEQSETEECCELSASTVHRWLNAGGRRVASQVTGQWAGVAGSGQMGVDGLWARLRGGAQRVVLLLTDAVTGLVWPPVVGQSEEQACWADLFLRAAQAGLDWLQLDGVTADGAAGLKSWLQQQLPHVHLQRCVWHLWRNLGGACARLEEDARAEIERLVHAVLDAVSYEAAELALCSLSAHPQGSGVARQLRAVLDEALVHLLPTHQGLSRIGPEHLWRDFRLRLSHGRNHGSEQRLERAALLWALYHNFTPAQWRSERKRHYQHPGLSPLEVAGSPPGEASYLDALLI